jgi:hypothetical protein
MAYQNHRGVRGFGRAVLEELADPDGSRRAADAETNRLRDRVRQLEATLWRVQMVRCWTNEDGKRFAFADDIAAAITGAETKEASRG